MFDKATNNELIRRQIEAWFVSEQGEIFLQMERQRLGRILSRLSGLRILQVGMLGKTDFLQSSQIPDKMIAILVTGDLSTSGSTPISAGANNITGFICRHTELPVAADSLDVVVLPHVLEFTSDSPQVLKESQRVLTGNGHIAILGFNPYSFWWLHRLILGWASQAPLIRGCHISTAKIKGWLKLLNFSIITMEHFYYRLPIGKIKPPKKPASMEQLKGHFWPWFGSLYILVAEKRVVPLTPTKIQWRRRREMGLAGTTVGALPQKEINV